MSIKIFFCYAHEDELLLNKLKSHLRPLQRQKLIDVWHDRDINAGTEWEREIDKHLNEAQVTLLLISPDFMDSDYCYSVEMQRAIERHERRETCVIPIILRHVYWQGTLGKLKALPTDGIPATDSNWHNLDRAFFNVAEGIRKVVENLSAKIQWLDEGNTQYKAKQYDKALAAYDQALQNDDSFVEAYEAKGNVLRELQRYQEALAAYERITELKPDYVSAWYDKGNVLHNLKRYEEALEAFEHALVLDSEKVWAWYHKGNALSELKRYQEALEAYEKAIKIGSNFPNAHHGRGVVLSKLKRNEEALVEFEQAITLDSGYALAWRSKGDLLFSLERNEEALEAYQKALKFDPDNAIDWHNMATLHERLAQLAHKRAEQLGYKEVPMIKLTVDQTEQLRELQSRLSAAQLALREKEKAEIVQTEQLRELQGRLSAAQLALREKEKAEVATNEQNGRMKHIVCMVVMPFRDSQSFAYETVLLPALRAVLEQAPYYWQVVRADEKYFADTIDRNVAVWMKRSHAYIADISDLNPNVMMGLGYMRWAREPWQPVIVLERAHTGVLLDPADLWGIIRMHYPAASGRHAADEIAEVLQEKFAKDESVQKLNRLKQEHYLSPLVLINRLDVGSQTADILSRAYPTMEAIANADTEDILRRVPNLRRAMAKALQEEVADLLKELKASQ